MVRYFKVLVFLSFLFSIVACEKGDDEILKKNFFPVYVGKSAQYEVNETRYSISESPKTSKWYLKETIGDVIGEINGFSIYKVERYRKSKLQDEWTIDAVWTIYEQPDKVVKVEDNVAYVKLITPIMDNASWNGNGLNNEGEAVYKAHYKNSSILEVTQVSDSSLIHLNKQKETYEAEKGLIFKELKSYEYCQSSPSCIGQKVIVSGRDISYKLIEP